MEHDVSKWNINEELESSRKTKELVLTVWTNPNKGD